MEDEIYAIQAIYCGDGEFETIQNGKLIFGDGTSIMLVIYC